MTHKTHSTVRSVRTTAMPLTGRIVFLAVNGIVGYLSTAERTIKSHPVADTDRVDHPESILKKGESDMIEHMARIQGRGLFGIYEVEKDTCAIGSPYSVFITTNRMNRTGITTNRRLISKFSTFRDAMNYIISRYENPHSS